MVLSVSGLVIEANLEAANHLGLPPHRLLGLELSKFWPKSAAEIMDAMTGGRQAIGLVPPELDNCYIQVKPLAGNNPGATVTIFDQRLWQPYLKAGQPLDPLTPYYKQIFESSSDGISIVDAKERVLLINDAAARQMGTTREELQGRRISYLVEHKYISETISQEVLGSGKAVTRLVRHFRTGKHILITGTPIFSPDGEARLVVINERDLTELLELQTSLQRHKTLINHFKDEIEETRQTDLSPKEVVSRSPAMARSLETAAKLARYDAPQVLITGESGTGKGLVAKFIHSKSKRAVEPFIHINCAALPEHLLEAELFGYEKGAFTGAAPEGRAGLFEIAGKGTVFMDEIGEMPLTLQTKLLTFLDTRSFRRISGHRIITSDAAIIAATNQDLRSLMERKLFRGDLFFRLSVFCLNIPPLRDRKEDIAEIARRELARLNERYEVSRELDPAAFEALRAYPFPGNVRELLNCLHQAVLLSDRPEIGEFLAQTLEEPSPIQASESSAEEPAPPQLQKNLEDIEKKTLLKALSSCRNTREMAIFLGISQAGVSRKLRKHGLPLPRNRNGDRARASDAPQAFDDAPEASDDAPRAPAEEMSGQGGDEAPNTEKME
jgi:PAS domain S-box-containing protein